jgi:quinol-cytochrome oxidoreductase complex cytochrome b subunit
MEHLLPGFLFKIFNNAIEWMDERFQVKKLFEGAMHVFIPKESKTFYLGGMTLMVFIIQGITGALMTLYYQPTPENAYDSVLYITSSVNFGWLIRSIHSWAANLMIILCVLHLLRVFIQGAYKRPREFTWIIGVGLLGVTLGFGFTGYLLPWDERAFWATTVGSESFGAVPFVGEFLLNFMRGGADVTGATLNRFFGVHVMWLPIALISLIGVHLLLLHQQGLANPKKLDDPNISPEEKATKAKPFFPDYVMEEGIAWFVILAILIILASLFPVGLEEKANPLVTPPHIKPEWYFLFLYQFLKLVPRTVGIIVPGIGVVILLILPFLDKSKEVLPRKRKTIVGIGLVTLIAILALTIWGHYS